MVVQCEESTEEPYFLDCRGCCNTFTVYFFGPLLLTDQSPESVTFFLKLSNDGDGNKTSSCEETSR